MAVFTLPPYRDIKQLLATYSTEWDKLPKSYAKYPQAVDALNEAVSLVTETGNMFTPPDASIIDQNTYTAIKLFLAFRKLEAHILFSPQAVFECTSVLKTTLYELLEQVGSHLSIIKTGMIDGDLNPHTHFQLTFRTIRYSLKRYTPKHLLQRPSFSFNPLQCCMKPKAPDELNYHNVDAVAIADAKIQAMMHLRGDESFSEIYHQVCTCLELFDLETAKEDKFVNLLLKLYLNLIYCMDTDRSLLDNDYKTLIDSRDNLSLRKLVFDKLESDSKQHQRNFLLKECICTSCSQKRAKFNAICTQCNRGICSTCYDYKKLFCHVCVPLRMEWVKYDLLPWAIPTNERYTQIQYKGDNVETLECGTRLAAPLSTIDRATFDAADAAYDRVRKMERQPAAAAWGQANANNAQFNPDFDLLYKRHR